MTMLSTSMNAAAGNRRLPPPVEARNGPADHQAQAQRLTDPAAARGRGLLFRSPPADGQVGNPVSRLGHLCAGELHRHRPPDQGRRRLRQGRRRAEDAPLLQGARLRRRDCRRALALSRHPRRAVRRHHHEHADGHDARDRRMVRQCSGRGAVRREGASSSRRRNSSGRRSSSRIITATTWRTSRT